MKGLLNLFLVFFRIGGFTFGGGYAMLPFIEQELVDRKRWIGREEFLDLFAIAQSIPGVFAVNMSISIGYKLRGLVGAVVCAIGTILPSFAVILCIAMFFIDFREPTCCPYLFRCSSCGCSHDRGTCLSYVEVDENEAIGSLDPYLIGYFGLVHGCFTGVGYHRCVRWWSAIHISAEANLRSA